MERLPRTHRPCEEPIRVDEVTEELDAFVHHLFQPGITVDLPDFAKEAHGCREVADVRAVVFQAPTFGITEGQKLLELLFVSCVEALVFEYVVRVEHRQYRHGVMVCEDTVLVIANDEVRGLATCVEK